MTERDGRERSGWGALLVTGVATGIAMLVLDSLSRVFDTIGDLGAGHGFGDIALALLAIIEVLAVVAAIAAARKARFARASSREEELEERRAWLADLREQGAPWHQRSVQRLSLVFVAAPVMAVRRGLRARIDPTARQRVHSFSLAMVATFVFFSVDDGFDLVQTAVFVAVVVLVDCLACWVIGRRERRRAR